MMVVEAKLVQEVKSKVKSKVKVEKEENGYYGLIIGMKLFSEGRCGGEICERVWLVQTITAR